MNRLILLFNTVKYLKKKQVYFRVFYFIRFRWRKIINFRYPLDLESRSKLLHLYKSIQSYISYDEKKFTFLHCSHSFEIERDWNFSKYGKLWTYNLTYFDYLHQEDMLKDTGLNLIDDFIEQSKNITDGLEPFPISLRGINWIKFLNQHNVQNQKINDSLYAQYNILIDSLEYHILGNHLLENGFSLLFGAYYFQEEKFYIKAKKILINELEEQVLKDGAHFELSPMYHQLMLFRVLDCINLVKNNQWKNDELYGLLIEKADLMIGWLNTMTFNNGDIPLFNDSTKNIAPTTKELNAYAVRLGLQISKTRLSDSGYRKIEYEDYEMIVDVGNIGPDYIPGHAHSDTFSFELYIKNIPIIVDTGTSTYQTNERRQIERSTRSHNTVEVDEVDQSEVWGGFRVARRAKIIQIEEKNGYIKATHNGYEKKGILHTREFASEDDRIKICDSIEGKNDCVAVTYFHFHPDVILSLKNNTIDAQDFTLTSTESIELDEYYYSPQFNTEIKAQCVKIYFSKALETNITLKDNNENN